MRRTECHSSFTHGFRYSYLLQTHGTVMLQYCVGACVQLFGPRQAEAIVLPPCENFMNSEEQRTVAVKMLSSGLQRGLVVRCDNKNIVVYRLCKSVRI